MSREPRITLVLLNGYYGAIIWGQTRIIHGFQHNANLKGEGEGGQDFGKTLILTFLYRVLQNLVFLFWFTYTLSIN